MPFCREKVENPAVNYRGAKKIGGAKTRNGSVEQGTDIPKIKPKIGNTPSRLGKSRTKKAVILPLSYCSHTTKAPIKPSVYAVLWQDTPQFVANLSLISYYLPWSGILVSSWSWCVGVVLVMLFKMSQMPAIPAKEKYLTRHYIQFCYVLV